MAESLAHQLECSVCYGLLVDPVVGKCGHDFCLACLSTWCQEAAKLGKPPSCPLCRSALDSSNLAVCIRLKHLTEQLFPDKVAERRAEMQQAAAQRTQGGRPGTSRTPATQQRQGGVAGRSRYLRARRTLHHRQQQHQQQRFSIGQPGSSHSQAYIHAFAVQTTAGLEAGTSSQHQQQQQQLHALLMSLQPGQGSPWVAPQVNFTMGWWEPSEKRRRHARSRMPERVGLVAQSQAQLVVG